MSSVPDHRKFVGKFRGEAVCQERFSTHTSQTTYGRVRWVGEPSPYMEAWYLSYPLVSRTEMFGGSKLHGMP